MERKRIEKLVALLLVGILMPVSLFPFRINADTINSTNVIGVNVELLGSTTLEHREDNGNNYYYKQYSYKAVIELDNSYVGVIGARVQGQYYEKAPVQGSQLLTQSFNYYRKIYVNGNTAEMTFVVSTWYSSVQDPINYRSDGTSPSVSIEDSNVVKYEDIDSIEQILDLLSDIYQNSEDIEGLSTDQLSELQSIVSNTSLANTYLETLSKLRQWHLPIESFSYVYALLNKYPNKVINTQNMYYFNYPVFQLNSGDELINYYLNFSDQYIELVLGINKNIGYGSVFKNFFTSSEEYIIKDFQSLNLNYGVPLSDSYLRIIKVKISTNGNTSSSFQLFVNSDTKIIPIYMKRSDQTLSISTDFALMFGLSNQLLDDVHIIAQGTSQSSSASGSLDQTTSQFSDDANDLVTIEESFNNSMNQSLQSVNPTFNMGSSFLTSANWVSQQFNRIVNNTPFASLITFGLTLGLGLLIIGKVRK